MKWIFSLLGKITEASIAFAQHFSPIFVCDSATSFPNCISQNTCFAIFTSVSDFFLLLLCIWLPINCVNSLLCPSNLDAMETRTCSHFTLLAFCSLFFSFSLGSGCVGGEAKCEAVCSQNRFLNSRSVYHLARNHYYVTAIILHFNFSLSIHLNYEFMYTIRPTNNSTIVDWILRDIEKDVERLLQPVSQPTNKELYVLWCQN